MPALRVLFICSQNKLRSPTAEHVFADYPGIECNLVLEGGQVAAIQHCENQGCLALIVGASVVTAATVIVSGSIVVVGNVVSWLERKARCLPSL